MKAVSEKHRSANHRLQVDWTWSTNK